MNDMTQEDIERQVEEGQLKLLNWIVSDSWKFNFVEALWYKAHGDDKSYTNGELLEMFQKSEGGKE